MNSDIKLNLYEISRLTKQIDVHLENLVAAYGQYSLAKDIYNYIQELTTTKDLPILSTYQVVDKLQEILNKHGL